MSGFPTSRPSLSFGAFKPPTRPFAIKRVAYAEHAFTDRVAMPSASAPGAKNPPPAAPAPASRGFARACLGG